MAAWFAKLSSAPDSPIVKMERDYWVIVNNPTLGRQVSWHRYALNSIRSTEVSDVLVPFYAMILQLRSLAIVTHLVIAALTLIPSTAFPSPAYRFVPVVIVFVISAIPTIVTHIQVRRHDSALNNATVQRIIPQGTSGRHNSALLTTSVAWHRVSPGDVVQLRRGDRCGADLLLLSSSSVDMISATIDTTVSTGETVFQPVVGALTETFVRDSGATTQNIAALRLALRVPFPKANNDNWRVELYHCEDAQLLGSDWQQTMSLFACAGPESLLPRGSLLVATEWALAAVIYTGRDTRPERTATRARTKSLSPHVIYHHLVSVAVVSFIVIAAILISSLRVGLAFPNFPPTDQWYVEPIDAHGPSWSSNMHGWKLWATTFANWAILLSSAMPLWRDALRKISAAFHAARIAHLLSDESPTEVNVITCGLPAATVSHHSAIFRLPSVTHVFFDKTGTVTTNKMVLVEAQVLDVALTFSCDTASNLTLEVFQDPTLRPRLAQFWTACALTNVVYPFRGSSGELDYESASTDEIALVRGAAAAGYRLTQRTFRGCSLQVSNVHSTLDFDVLCVLGFTSTRRRMTILLAEPGGEVVVYTKGSFDSLRPLLAQGSPNTDYLHTAQAASVRMEASGKRSFLFATRRLQRSDVVVWLQARTRVETSAADLGALVQLDAVIERDFTIVGVAGVSDTVDPRAASALGELATRGVRSWMVTGDSRLAAVAIAKSLGFCRIDGVPFDPVFRHLDADTTESTTYLLRAQIERALAAVGRFTSRKSASLNGGPSKPVVIIVDGKAYDQIAMDDKLRGQFIRLCVLVQGGIACRFTPKQKAQLVSLFKREIPKETAVVLAVGDGGNDALMIEDAHVGIALSGGEASLQARRAADVVLRNFGDLPALLRHSTTASLRENHGSTFLLANALAFAWLRSLSSIATGNLQGIPELTQSTFVLFEIIGCPLWALIISTIDHTTSHVFAVAVTALTLGTLSFALRFNPVAPGGELPSATFMGFEMALFYGPVLTIALLFDVNRSQRRISAPLCGVMCILALLLPIVVIMINRFEAAAHFSSWCGWGLTAAVFVVTPWLAVFTKTTCPSSTLPEERVQQLIVSSKCELTSRISR
jgi:magnesium-transporting ATPase (P-type)